MKITKYELFQVPPRWLFLKIETDEGIVGWGEPIVEGKAATVKAAVQELMENLIGKNPMDIEGHWNNMYRGNFYRGGPVLMSAISGIDQALWDIKGKFFNAPVYQLIGGKTRDKMRVYSWIGGDRPTDIGFVNIPFGPGLGIKINETRVKEMAKEGHNWRNPLWYHEDGSVAEW